MSSRDDAREVARLRAEVQQLTQQVERLRETVAENAASDSAPGPGYPAGPMSRRGLLRLAGAGAVGTAGAMLAASPAQAADPNDVVLGGSNDAGSLQTTITSNHGSRTLSILNTADTSSICITAEANDTASVNSIGVAASGKTGMQGSSSVSGGQGVAGYASATDTIGVRADASATNAVGFKVTNPGTNSVGVWADGTRAPLFLQPFGSTGAPSDGTHAAGELVVDAAGSLFFCVTGGSPGVWTKLNNQAGPGGGPNLVNPPQRVYDSRVGRANPSGSPQGTLAFGATRTINCSPSVPSGAVAIMFNLTVTNTVGSSGALNVFAANAVAPTTSNINWSSAGTSIANFVVSACDTSQDVKVKCVSTAGSATNFILDVFGYYL